ncbi:MAG: hypothetical protein ACSHWZ_03250 [Sulfitobacter sp.]
MIFRVARLAGLGMACITAIAHVFIGSFDTLLPLLQAEVAPVIKGTFHACWHFVSIFLVFSVWSFIRKAPFAPQLALLWVAFSACFIIAGITAAGISGLLLLPQWLFLGAAGILLMVTTPKGGRDQG